MVRFIAGLVGDATAPLVGAIADFSARLLRRLALFLVAALCMVAVTIALTIAFDLWIATLAGPIAAALAVAGVYLAIAVLAVLLALRNPAAKPSPSTAAAQPAAAASRNPDLGAQIDQFTKPILDLLERFGLRREQLAVFAGATMAKRLGPVPLVGCAIVVGFLVGRLWRSWRHCLEAGLALSPFLAEMFGAKDEAVADRPPAT